MTLTLMCVCVCVDFDKCAAAAATGWVTFLAHTRSITTKQPEQKQN